MKNCELLSSISVNAGVAVNLSRDSISSVLLNGEILTDGDIERIGEIGERLSEAVKSATELQKRLISGKRSNFWEAEQFEMFKS